MAEIDSHRINFKSSLIGQYHFHFYFNVAKPKHSHLTSRIIKFLKVAVEFIILNLKTMNHLINSRKENLAYMITFLLYKIISKTAVIYQAYKEPHSIKCAKHGTRGNQQHTLLLQSHYDK